MDVGLLAAALAALLRFLGWWGGYLGNGSFPKPLSAQEEARYVEAWLRGDREARNKLVEHNLRLVAHIVKKFESSRENQEDLISVGNLGLMKAVDSFDPGRGTKLATYAAKCIENEILMYLRSQKKTHQEVSLQDPIGTDREGNEVTLMDVLSSEEDTVPDLVNSCWERSRVREWLGALPGKEREVLEKRYGLRDGVRRTQRDIARQLGISRSYVSRIEKRAIQSMTSMLRSNWGSCCR
ncbi:MAG TPA: RNA polymerase sporulation sigma factor SigK [Firmicutes bacterium]|nr:RNA polymerase sporulation sigma factor SigK [Bacillota bacterium]